MPVLGAIAAGDGNQRADFLLSWTSRICLYDDVNCISLTPYCSRSAMGCGASAVFFRRQIKSRTLRRSEGRSSRFHSCKHSADGGKRTIGWAFSVL